jgi:hypothetical protein
MTVADAADAEARPTATDSPLEPSRPSRPSRRGGVTSYGDGRRCMARGCTTTLSRYNSTDRCGVHEIRGNGR